MLQGARLAVSDESPVFVEAIRKLGFAGATQQRDTIVERVEQLSIVGVELISSRHQGMRRLGALRRQAASTSAFTKAGGARRRTRGRHLAACPTRAPRRIRVPPRTAASTSNGSIITFRWPSSGTVAKIRPRIRKDGLPQWSCSIASGIDRASRRTWLMVIHQSCQRSADPAEYACAATHGTDSPRQEPRSHP